MEVNVKLSMSKKQTKAPFTCAQKWDEADICYKHQIQ